MNKEHKELYSKLTRLQKGVCLGILEGKVYTKAYYDAGGLAKSDEYANQIVSRMLSTDVNVLAFMSAMEEEAISDAVMTKREALERLSAIANTSVADLVNFRAVEIASEDGEPVSQSVWALKAQGEINDHAMTAISELSAGRDGFKFKLHSSVAAIKELAGLLGWNSPIKQEITGKDGGAIEVSDMSEREIARRIAFALAKGVRESEQNIE